MIRLQWAIDTLTIAREHLARHFSDSQNVTGAVDAYRLMQEVIAELQGEQAAYEAAAQREETEFADLQSYHANVEAWERRLQAEKDNDDLYGDYRRGKG